MTSPHCGTKPERRPCVVHVSCGQGRGLRSDHLSPVDPERLPSHVRRVVAGEKDGRTPDVGLGVAHPSDWNLRQRIRHRGGIVVDQDHLSTIACGRLAERAAAREKIQKPPEDEALTCRDEPE